MEHLEPQFCQRRALRDMIQVVVGIHHGENLGKDIRHNVFQVHPERLPEKGDDSSWHHFPASHQETLRCPGDSIGPEEPQVNQNNSAASEEAKCGHPGLMLTVLVYLTVNQCCLLPEKPFQKKLPQNQQCF